MAEQTQISWADCTFNPWIGCTKVSAACDFCYAERDNERRKWVPGWGAGVPRRLTKTWSQPRRWHRKALQTGVSPRVFCASLADVFDNEVPDEWRADLWSLIRETYALEWMLLTKRIGNAEKMLPADWTGGDFEHVGLMATMENQEVFDRDIAKLLRTPAPWRGISMEPMLGPIYIGYCPVEWIITGGESGPNARPSDEEWFLSMQNQCEKREIAYHHKQNGGIRPKDNGCLIGGREFKEFPASLAA